MTRRPGVSVRLKLALSYTAVVMLTGMLLLAVVWVFLLRYVPPEAVVVSGGDAPGLREPGMFIPGRDDLWRAFAPPASAALAFLLLVGLVGGWALAGRMLAPLGRITAATRLADAGSLSHRIRLPGREDEFRELADAFDAMLARLETHVAEQRRFAANASHELRTPLAITQTLLEVGRANPSGDQDDKLLARLQEVNRRAIDLTEALLVLSRADQRAFERETVDLSLMAEQATETLLPLAEEVGVAIEPALEPAHTFGSSALLQQLTTNLVHNAIVHNLPSDGWVLLRTTATPGVVTLIVENTGARLDPLLVATLIEPFHRGTQRVRGDHAGVGLGLAIVRSITEAHQGRLELSARADGGLMVTVSLPAAT
jgi:two-component system sensor histidine kinase VanS